MHIKDYALIALGFALSAALCTHTAIAAPNLTLGSVTQAVQGQGVNIPVTFDNDVTVTGLQFDVQYNTAQLNAGTALAGSALSATGHGVSSSLISANTLRVVVTPPSNNAVLTAGTLATIPWTINPAATGGPQALTLSNVVFTDNSAVSVAAGTLTNGNLSINYAPVASNKTLTTNEDQAVSSNLIASDNDNEPVTYAIVTNPSHGVVILTSNTGAFTYTPAANVSGSDSFTFRASDGKVTSNVATATINLASVNDAPVLSVIGNQSLNEGATKTLALSATDVDTADTLTFSATGLPAFATLTNNGNRSASLSLAPNYTASGTYSITVTVADNGTPILSAGETFTLTVNNVNAPPTANAGPDQTVNGGAAVSMTGSGSDLDGTISSYAWTQVSGTAVTLSGATTTNASFTAPAVNGTTYLTFQLKVTDNGGATGTDQIIITVKPTGKPDLTISAIGSPLTAKAGASITVSNTVANNGTADAEGNFDVGVYLIPQPVLFSSTFDSGTLEGWSALKTGGISVINDATDGYVLKKATTADPNGGQALLSTAVSDFELTVYTKRLSTGTAKTNCYSLTGATGNGYGLCLNYTDGKLYLNKRGSWAITSLGTAAAVTGGTVVNQWYTLQLIKQGSSLTAKAYLGKVVPSTATAIATVTNTNTTYTSFTQVNVNGGYDYYSDNVKVVQLVSAFPTNGSEILLGKRTVFSLLKSATSVGDVAATIPLATPVGTYAIAAKADMYATLTESSETNNVLFGTKLFAVTPP
ncbi:MAG: cadherin-like domain-containing protein [Gammaproteobacteria bacterium]|nr:cadherin-like domain-containing protein [Gammaproteobacteria bacterium]